jgi:hypothetical protein
MRTPIVSRIGTWLLAGTERLWSQLAPRREAGEIAAVAVDAAWSRRGETGETRPGLVSARPGETRPGLVSKRSGETSPLEAAHRWSKSFAIGEITETPWKQPRSGISKQPRDHRSTSMPGVVVHTEGAPPAQHLPNRHSRMQIPSGAACSIATSLSSSAA